MNKKTKTIWRITLLVFAAIVVGLNVYTLNASKLAGDSVPMPFGVGVTVVLSGSMEPEMSTGDLLIVTKRASYNVGDDVVYQEGRITVVHRIIAMEGDTVTTRGLANNTEDDPITLEQIKGAVAFSIPLVGYIVNIIKTPVATALILVATFCLLERSFKREKAKDEEKSKKIKAEIETLKQKQNPNK